MAALVRGSDLLGVAGGAAVATALVVPSAVPAAAVAALGALWFAGQRRWRFTVSLLDELPRLAGSLVLAGAVATAAVAVVALACPPREVAVAGGVIAVVALLSRSACYLGVRWARAWGLGRSSAVIVGGGPTVDRVARALAENPRLGATVLGRVDDGAESGELPRLGRLEDLPEIVIAHGASLVILGTAGRQTAALDDAIRELTLVPCEIFRTTAVAELHEDAHRGDLVGGVPLYRLSRTARRGGMWPVKRLLDVGLGLVGLVVASPVMLVIAVALRVETRASVFFRQKRLGLDGRPFTLYKFQSLPPVGDEGEVRWNIDGDSRLGPVGAFIRRTSLDELPQLVNIVKGDMSLVGPRPERPYFADRFSTTVPGYRYRLRVPVGLTGYAAVNGLRGHTSVSERVEYDNLYVDSWSFWLDIKVLLRTLRQVVYREPAPPAPPPAVAGLGHDPVELVPSTSLTPPVGP